MLRTTSLIVVNLLFVTSLAAQDAAPTTLAERTIVIRPVKESPAETVSLVYDMSEQRPGNAAIDLYKALLLAHTARIDFDKLQDLENATVESRATVLKQAKDVLRYLDYAARCRTCDWQVPWNDEPPFGVLLPELQTLRNLQRLLMLRAQNELAQGDVTAALATLRTGYAIARHTAAGPTLIHGLVGVAMGTLVNAQLEQILQHGRCPSLYWALQALPRPFVDLRPAIRFEATAVELQFPQLKQLRDASLDPKLATGLVSEMVAQFAPLVSAQENATPESSALEVTKLMAALMVFADAPAARERLSRAGYTAAHIERMALPQLALLDSYQLYKRQYTLMQQWFELPLDVALRVEPVHAQRWSGDEFKSQVYLFQALAPAVTNAYKLAARIDRQFAALMVVDAVRRYAAEHQGALPAALSELTELPLPHDPFTGRTFEYARTDESATITAGPVGDIKPNATSVWRYKLVRAE